MHILLRINFNSKRWLAGFLSRLHSSMSKWWDVHIWCDSILVSLSITNSSLLSALLRWMTRSLDCSRITTWHWIRRFLQKMKNQIFLFNSSLSIDSRFMQSSQSICRFRFYIFFSQHRSFFCVNCYDKLQFSLSSESKWVNCLSSVSKETNLWYESVDSVDLTRKYREIIYNEQSSRVSCYIAILSWHSTFFADIC